MKWSDKITTRKNYVVKIVTKTQLEDVYDKVGHACCTASKWFKKKLCIRHCPWR